MSNSVEAKEWKIDKTINVGHIVVTVSLVISAFFWVSSVEERFVTHNKDIEALSDRFDRQEKRLDNDIKDIKEALIDIQRYLRDYGK